VKRITINPVTRLEGHGKVEIFLDEHGEVANSYLQIPELRGFEKFCEGRAAEEMPMITARICGVCPEAHHMASTKALDALYHVEPPPGAKKLRELLYSAFFVTDHATHFYFLGGPDFIVGPDAPPAERNIFGVIRKVGLEAGRKVIRLRAQMGQVLAMLAARQTHPIWGLPGGVSKGLDGKERKKVIAHAHAAVEFSRFTLDLFDQVVLKNPDYVELIRSEGYAHRTYYMGMVDAKNRVNFYDGDIRVVDPDGREFAKFPARDYREHVAERVEPWSYLKFPYLKKVGWAGFVDGKDSGIYRATPLSRLNAADGMATPLAQTAYRQMYQTLGGKPVHATLATRWARIIEMLYAAERLRELAEDPEILDTVYRVVPQGQPDEGVGCVEAPRGTLFHHYWTDEKGILRKVNLIVGTTHNNAAISLSLNKAARAMIHKGKAVTEGLLNRIEMAYRAYDPCIACATHAVDGRPLLEVNVRDDAGQVVQRIGAPGRDTPPLGTLAEGCEQP